MCEIKKIPDAELEIMHVIWEKGTPVTSDDVMEGLDTDWKKTTVLNFLTRLCERGFLKIEKSGRTNIYTALISRDEYMRCAHKSLLKKFHQKSITDFVASLYDVSAITDNDLKELEEFITEVRE